MSLAEKQGSVAPADIPVIDISGLATSGPAADAIVAAIGEACRRIGFFVVTGHGVPAATLTAAATNTRAFFALPVADKLALSIELSPHNRGYVRLQSETLNLDRPADEKEAFNIGLDLTPDDPEVVAGKRFRGVNVWPDLPGWRAGMLDYFDRNTRLGLALLSAFARDLGEPADRFRSWMERPSATLRLLRYPPQPPVVSPAGRAPPSASAPASTPTMARSRSSPSSTAAGSRSAGATGNGYRCRLSRAVSSATSANA